VKLEGMGEEGELDLAKRLAQGVTREHAEDVLVSVAADEREPEPLLPLAFPVGRVQAADTSTAFPTMDSIS
jgi:hypothetical protein